MKVTQSRSRFWQRRFKRKVTLLIACGVIVSALTLALHSSGALTSFELSTVDWRFETRGATDVPRDVVVVAIDDVSFEELRLRYQDWSRRYHARVLRVIARAHAKAVIYDVQFTEPSKDLDGDWALYTAAGLAKPVIFATTEVDEHGGTGVLGSNAKSSAAHLRQIGAHAGQSLMPDEPSGAMRHMSYTLNGLKSLGVVAAEAVTGESIEAPSGLTGSEWIDYAGPPGTIDRISFSRVYNGQVDPARLKGKIVVVGPTAPSLHDVHPTSAGGGQMSGAEIQANAFDTARRHFPLRSANGVVDVLLILALAFLAPLLTIRLSPLLTLPIVAVAAGAYVLVVQLAFRSGTILPLVAPLLVLILATMCAVAVQYLTETRERRRLRKTLSRFVPKAHVDQLIARGKPRLEGETLQCTVMFCDLRKFTTFVEMLHPEDLIKLLNRYLGEMSRAIEKHEGTVVSYQGDGIMAVFGAPIESDDHADWALAAAREMLTKRLTRFNDWIEQQRLKHRLTGAFDKPPSNGGEPKAHYGTEPEDRSNGYVFEMGIGIYSGLVLSGNVGSKRRMEYTAAGDATNAASRLEAMAKDSEEHSLFVGDTTRQLLRDGSNGLTYYGNVVIRGRIGETMVWVPRKDWLGATYGGRGRTGQS
jgi:adenylate cyclase